LKEGRSLYKRSYIHLEFFELILPTSSQEIIMKLNEKAFALSAGVVWGLVVFLATIIMVLKGYPGKTISNLGGLYIGYSVSYVGSVIGLIWGFVTMAAAAWVFALLYNKLLGSGSAR
jgi:hypothetical protein